MKTIIFEHRCINCDRLLFKGVLLSGNLEVKCIRCKTVNNISGTGTVAEEADDHYLLLFDYAGNITDASISAEQILGYSREELLKMNRNDLNKDLNPTEYLGFREALLRINTPVAFDTIHIKKNGEAVPVKVRVRVLNIGDVPSVALIIAHPIRVGSDLDQKALIAPYEFEINTSGQITYINTAGIALLGYRIFSKIGHPIEDLFTSKNCNFSQLVKSRRFFEARGVEVRSADGAYFTMDLSFHPRVEDDEAFVGYSIAGIRAP